MFIQLYLNSHSIIFKSTFCGKKIEEKYFISMAFIKLS